MDEVFLSEAIHHGFLFRKLTLGGEHDRTESDKSRQKDTVNKSSFCLLGSSFICSFPTGEYNLMQQLHDLKLLFLGVKDV